MCGLRRASAQALQPGALAAPALRRLLAELRGQKLQLRHGQHLRGDLPRGKKNQPLINTPIKRKKKQFINIWGVPQLKHGKPFKDAPKWPWVQASEWVGTAAGIPQVPLFHSVG